MNLRRKIFSAIILATILAAIVIRSPISVIPFLYVSIAMILSGAYLFIIKNSCEVLVETSTIRKFRRKSKERYSISIRNKSFLVFPKVSLSAKLVNLDGDVFKEYEFDFILNNREKNIIEIDLEFPHIGNYIFKIENLKIYGIFDFAYVNYNPKWEEHIKVEAREYIISDFKIDTRDANIPVEFTVPTKIEGEIYDDIREYMPGDPIKNIHWKLSAHANVYMTRILKIDAISGVSIFLDFNARNGENIFQAAAINDGLIEIALLISSFAIENKRAVSLRYGENSIPVNHLVTDYLGLREKICDMPKFSIREGYPIEMLLENYGKNDDNILVFTTNISDELLASLSNKAEKGKRAAIFYVENEKRDKDIKNLKDSGIEYYVIETPEKFVESLGGREASEKE